MSRPKTPLFLIWAKKPNKNRPLQGGNEASRRDPANRNRPASDERGRGSVAADGLPRCSEVPRKQELDHAGNDREAS